LAAFTINIAESKFRHTLGLPGDPNDPHHNGPPYQAAGAQICEQTDLGTNGAIYDMPPGRVKKDRAVIVPLSDVACTIIDEAIEDKKQKVLFPSKFDEATSTSIARASISQALNGKKNGKKVNGKTEDRIGIREFLGMAHFTAQDLRRTAATIARRAGAPRPDVKALLDHVNGDVTEVYDRPVDDRWISGEFPVDRTVTGGFRSGDRRHPPIEWEVNGDSQPHGARPLSFSITSSSASARSMQMRSDMTNEVSSAIFSFSRSEHY
jgi:Phage integrase family